MKKIVQYQCDTCLRLSSDFMFIFECEVSHLDIPEEAKQEYVMLEREFVKYADQGCYSLIKMAYSTLSKFEEKWGVEVKVDDGN